MKKFSILAILASLASVFATGCNGSASSAAPERDSTYTTLTQPEWSRNAIIYEVNLRQYTPSASVTEFASHLPRLKELGVDILWFMPIHPISELNRKGELGSYYAVKDYKAFNPEFGTIDQFKEMVDSAHALGMKVILDWVPNHTGCDNAWVAEHPEWFSVNEEGKMYGPFDWTDVYELNYDNREMRAAMIDALKFWLTDINVDGFRCDVAGEVPTDFWNEARPQLDAAKADIFMLAEASKPELQKHAFNMGYNWPMKDLFSEIAATSGQYTFKKEGEPMRTFPIKHATAIDSLLADQAREYPRDSYLMNMITNHDLNSWEGTEFERLGNLSQAFAVLSYTLPGMPLIYTGQETGMNRPFEFFKKDECPTWEPRNEYFEFYKQLGKLKHEQKALMAGEAGGEMKRYSTQCSNIYAFSRTKDESTVLVIVNLGSIEEYITFVGEEPKIKNLKNFFTGRQAKMPESLKAGEYLIFVK